VNKKAYENERHAKFAIRLLPVSGYLKPPPTMFLVKDGTELDISAEHVVEFDCCTHMCNEFDYCTHIGNQDCQLFINCVGVNLMYNAQSITDMINKLEIGMDGNT
jgi:hypothetical protein